MPILGRSINLRFRFSLLYRPLFISLITIILIAGCATPMGPTGGTPDRTGPMILDTYPASGTTNFDDDEVTFYFDKFVDRNSFRQNVSIEPDLGIEFETSFRRKSATVSFTNPLPENTTVVVKVGVDVTDTNRNKMSSSYDLALSTGDFLDDGEVVARIINAETGARESGRRVFLFREPVDFENRANYVSQTDTSGTANFGYLSEGTYRAIWINDVNRNRIWDRPRELAQPFHEESFGLGQGEKIDLGTLFYSIPDTVSPRLEGVGLLSEKRLRLRFSEEVKWDEESYFTLSDTLQNEITTAWPLYSSLADPTILFAQTETALDEDEFYTISSTGFADESGNRLRTNINPFQGSSEPDTTGLRTVSHNTGSGLFPDEPVEISYSKFIDDNIVVDSLLVFEGDQMFSDWENLEVDKHILKISPPNGEWQSGLRYEFRFWNPWESERERINPDFWQKNQLGSIEINIENGNEEVTKHLKLTDTNNSILVEITFTNSIEIDNLPPLEYTIKVFEDTNGNGVWDPGTVDPFVKPEPYAIRRSIPVREGFTSDVTLTFPVGSTIVDDEDEEINISNPLDEDL